MLETNLACQTSGPAGLLSSKQLLALKEFDAFFGYLSVVHGRYGLGNAVKAVRDCIYLDMSPRTCFQIDRMSKSFPITSVCIASVSNASLPHLTPHPQSSTVPAYLLPHSISTSHYLHHYSPCESIIVVCPSAAWLSWSCCPSIMYHAVLTAPYIQPILTVFIVIMPAAFGTLQSSHRPRDSPPSYEEACFGHGTGSFNAVAWSLTSSNTLAAAHTTRGHVAVASGNQGHHRYISVPGSEAVN